MHIIHDLVLENGVTVQHHEVMEVRFELGTNQISALVNSWVNTAARSDERPPVIVQNLELPFDPVQIAPMIIQADGNIPLAIYQAVIAMHFVGGTFHPN
jgi:hypothetical protein